MAVLHDLWDWLADCTKVTSRAPGDEGLMYSYGNFAMLLIAVAFILCSVAAYRWHRKHGRRP